MPAIPRIRVTFRRGSTHLVNHAQDVADSRGTVRYKGEGNNDVLKIAAQAQVQEQRRTSSYRDR